MEKNAYVLLPLCEIASTLIIPEFNKTVKELLDELKYVTYESFNAKHDDGLDLISMLAAMHILFPQAGQTLKPIQKSYQMWGFEEEDTIGVNAYDGY